MYRQLITLFFIAFFTLGTVLILPAQAQESAENEKHTAVSITPEFTDIKAGDTLFVAIKQTIDPHWHTYWRNPGDSGEPMRVHWKLPAGIIEKDLKWPTPKPIPAGPLTNYGYEDEATLLQEFTITPDLPEGPLEIRAEIDILVCKEICIPEYHDVTFMLNEGKNEINADIINAAYNELPVTVDWGSSYSKDKHGNFELVLDFEQPGFITRGDVSVRFDILPHEWGLIENGTATTVKMDNTNKKRGYVLTLKKGGGERPLDNVGETRILVTYDVEAGKDYGALEITSSPNSEWLASLAEEQKKTPAVTNSSAPSPALQNYSFGMVLVLALLGGLVLNLMPCVFPVLSMKALSLVKMTEKSHTKARMHGIAYTLGVLLSFGSIAALLIALQSAGSQIGWGFQLQNPVVVLLLSYLLFMVGLNLSGFYEIGGGLANVGSKLGNKDGLVGSFFTGILATLVATPCTAPFMGVATGYAITQPPAISMIVFLTLGLGLALPYLLLSFFPVLRKALPKPGNWMIVFRELLAFPLYASAAWLVWVYSQQAGSMALLYALTGFVGIGFTIWIFRSAPKDGSGKIVLRGFAVIVLLTTLLLAVTESAVPVEHATQSSENEKQEWQSFTTENYEEALATDKPVFINMTAAWCITCKVNERVALNLASTKKTFTDHDVIYLKGDWTNQDASITKYLARYGRNGVPLYVFYGAPNPESGKRPEPKVLPQILTPGTVAGLFE